MTIDHLMTKHSIEKTTVIYIKSNIFTFSYKHCLCSNWIAKTAKIFQNRTSELRTDRICRESLL